ncbi:uncharacterized protein F4807DRAFT_406528 [Annulohypoxylon truncatum]|uniref:uncharacterized protein n=1 Tax=Annulohypoxylon truncatum TaxID=327061 RepID=UPI00200801E7|nr:uncharacterized protein F4807DRAFT_406528 [Annulohypoxylon truncatum]KAI1214068.1 hypothetical protein F4807DRAFT_406528 [Annulohypoxylon truncatum]
MASMGICEFGFQFYSCDNGFKGCCRVNACGPDQCPEGQRTTTSYPVPYIDSSTKANTVTPSATTIFTNTEGGSNGSSTRSTATTENTSESTTATIPQTSSPSSSSSPSASTSTPSPSTPYTTPAPPTVWVPIPTSAPQPSASNSSGEHPRLSATAIAGISVGGTMAVALLALIGFLLIRRHRIARRNARAPAANPFAFSSRDAEGFMADHPMWREGDDDKVQDGLAKGAARETGEVKVNELEARKNTGLRGLYELP